MFEFETLVKQLFKYGAVGLVGTLFHYSIFLYIYNNTFISASLASSCGFVIGAIVNHALNYAYVFKVNNSFKSSAIKFYIVAGIGFLLNLMIIFTMVDTFRINHIISQVVSTILVFFFTFLVNKFWTFSVVKGE